MKSNIAAVNFFARKKKQKNNLRPVQYKRILSKNLDFLLYFLLKFNNFKKKKIKTIFSKKGDIFSQDLTFASKREVVKIFTDLVITERLFDSYELLDKKGLAIPSSTNISQFREVFNTIDEQMIYKVLFIYLTTLCLFVKNLKEKIVILNFTFFLYK